MAEIAVPIVRADMAKGKRQKARGQRANAARQSQHGHQPSPVVATGSVQQVERSNEAPSAAAADNPQVVGHDPGKSATGRKQRGTDWHLFIAITEAAVSVCLLVLAVVGAWYAKGQLDAMREQNTALMQQNKLMLAQQRPWLQINGEPVGEPEAGQPWQFTFNIQNEGQSVANITGVSMAAFVLAPGASSSSIGRLTRSGASPQKDVERSDDIIRAAGNGYIVELDRKYVSELLLRGAKRLREDHVLPPNKTSGFTTDYRDPLDDKTVTAISNGSLVPIAIAVVVYSDASGEGFHWTRTMGIYNNETGKLDRLRQYGPD